MSARRRRTVVMGAGIAAVLAVTAACGSSGPQSESGDDGAASAWGLTGGDQPAFEASFEAWNSDHPDQAIDAQFFANDAYKQKVRTALGAGDAPTLLFGWGGGILESWVDAGKVVDLSGAVKDNPDLVDRFLPSIAATGEVDGKTYALPNNATQPVVLYYNKDLFEEVGVEPPETWDELMALVPEFNDAGIAPFAVGGQSKWPLLMWEEYLVDRIGGPEVFQAIAANEPDAWSDPAILEANERIQDLVEADGFVEGFNSIASDTGADLALLYTGKAAMVLMGTWGYATIKNDNPEFISSGTLGYTTFPTVEGGAGDPADIVGNPANFWSISADASQEEQDAALAYLTDGIFSDAYADDLLEAGEVPPLEGMEDALTDTDEPEYLSWVYDLAKQAPSFQLSWDQALSPGQADALLNNLDQLFLLEITPEEFSASMNETIGQ